MNQEQIMEELSSELVVEKPRKRRRSQGFGDPLEIKIESGEETIEETVEEPVAEEEKKEELVRHHEVLVRPLTRTKPVPKRGMKAAVRVRP